ncbi:MAG: ABC transporter permease [Actinomycetota bacterium]|nr:ABC transporter permease [Actinomycetota bacterium]MDQ5807830.1 ABC transporter permease [Actinomycetota bacterium]
MGQFILRRLIAMALVLFAVSVLIFAIFNVIPAGNPEDRMAGKQATPQVIEAIRKEWGFDKSLPVQYWTTMKNLFSGDLISQTNRVNVSEEIRRGAPRTFALAIGAAVIWFVVGVSLGLFTAARAGAWSDRLVTVLALIGISMPVFWLGALASYYLGYKWGIFPNAGYEQINEAGLWQWVYHLMLPWMVLATLFIGVYSRVVRGTVLDTINDDYVRTARAKGLSERRVLVKHVLRNSLIPVVTLWGLDFALVLGGGAILTETVFDLQGVGQYFAESIRRLDVPPVLAVTMYGAFFVVIFNTFVDIAYAALDPRIRLQ